MTTNNFFFIENKHYVKEISARKTKGNLELSDLEQAVTSSSSVGSGKTEKPKTDSFP